MLVNNFGMALTNTPKTDNRKRNKWHKLSFLEDTKICGYGYNEDDAFGTVEETNYPPAGEVVQSIVESIAGNQG